MRNIAQEYKALPLLPPQAITSTTSSTTTQNVEVYGDDAMAIVNLGAIGAGGSVIVTILGSLVATPTTYDQTLATFVSAATSYTMAAYKISLAGIKNLKATATLPGSTSVAIAISALVDINANASSANSLTAA